MTTTTQTQTSSSLTITRNQVAKATVCKGQGYWDVAVAGTTMGPGYKTKAAAEKELAVAHALVAAFYEATTIKLSYLDYAVLDAAEELKTQRRDMVRKFEKAASSLAEDAARIAAGGLPWYSDGQQTRTAVDLDLMVAAYKQAGEKFKTLAAVVRHDAPTSHAAVGLAVVRFLTAWNGGL